MESTSTQQTEVPLRSPLSPLLSPTFAPRRILVRGVNWLGDAVMTTPALQRLRERFPKAHITLLTPKKLADLWLEDPRLDEVMMFEEGESVWRVGTKIRTHQIAEAEQPNGRRGTRQGFE